MGKVETGIVINDGLSPAFKSMSSAMNIMISNFETLQKASGKAIDTSSIQAAKGYLNQAEAQFAMIEEQIDKAKNSQNQFNNSIQKGATHSASLVKTLMGLSVVQKVVGMVSNSMDSAISRLDTMNNFPKVMGNLGIGEEQAKASIDMLSKGLDGLPTRLNDAAAAVQRFTATNGNIGYSTKQFLALNNAILAGGMSTDIQTTALEQISQAYSKGKPDMVEWKSLQAAMPAQLQQIAQAMGMTEYQLGENLRTGKTSMGEFMDTIIRLNEEGVAGFKSFAEQARNATGGFGTSIQNMKTAVTRGVTEMITNINTALESANLPNIQTIITNIGSGIETMLGNIGNFAGTVTPVLSQVFQFVQSIGSFIVDNWSLIAPIIGGITGALLLYKGALIVTSIAQGINIALQSAAAFTGSVHAASLYMQAGATFAATVAQYGFNAALLACPITWIVIGILGAVAALYFLVAVFNDAAGASVSATGMIAGAFMWVVSLIWDLFLALFNFVLEIINLWVNKFIIFANFLSNVFKDPLASVIHLFGDMADAVLGIIESIARAIDCVFGSNLASAVQGWRGGLNAKIEAFANQHGNGSYEKIMENLNLNTESLGLERLSMTDMYNKGYDWGKGVDNKVSDFFNFDKYEKGTPEYDPASHLNFDSPALNNIAGDTGGAAKAAKDTAQNTGNIADKMDATSEDLKYLRDLAEQEVVNRFTTAEIRIDMTNNNSINSDMDLDGVVNILEHKLGQAMEVAAEGYHF